MILLHICIAAISTNLFLPIYCIPLYFQFTNDDTSLHAAVWLLPFILIGVLTLMLSAAFLSKFRYYMPCYVLSGVTSIVGGAVMYTVDATTKLGTVYGFSILIAIGAGAALQVGYSVASAKTDPKLILAAIGFINMAQLGGTTISLTIIGQIFQSFAFMNTKAALAGLGFSDQEVHAAIAGLQSDLLGTVLLEAKAQVLEGIVKAIDKPYLLIVAGGVVILMCLVLMKREKLFLILGAGA
jgi:hypothetical protein